MFGSFPPSPLVGLRLQSLLGPGADIVMESLHSLTRSHKFPDFLFCKSWIALVSLRRVRGLMVFFPFLKLLMAHSATLDRRERSFVENCFASARISSRYFASTTLSYSRNVSWVGSRAPASAIMDRSGPLPQRVDASLPM